MVTVARSSQEELAGLASPLHVNDLAGLPPTVQAVPPSPVFSVHESEAELLLLQAARVSVARRKGKSRKVRMRR